MNTQFINGYLKYITLHWIIRIPLTNINIDSINDVWQYSFSIAQRDTRLIFWNIEKSNLIFNQSIFKIVYSFWIKKKLFISYNYRLASMWKSSVFSPKVHHQICPIFSATAPRPTQATWWVTFSIQISMIAFETNFLFAKISSAHSRWQHSMRTQRPCCKSKRTARSRANWRRSTTKWLFPVCALTCPSTWTTTVWRVKCALRAIQM